MPLQGRNMPAPLHHCLVSSDHGMEGGRRTEGVAGLQHEAFDDAVEDNAVIVPVLGVRREVLDRLQYTVNSVQ